MRPLQSTTLKATFDYVLTMTAPTTALRSVLYVPGDKERALQKLATLPADVFVIDLEDAVAPERKPEARLNTASVLTSGAVPTPKLVVRVNGEADVLAHDLAALRGTTPRAVLLPKYESLAQLHDLRAAMANAGLPSAVQVWVMIETPQGIAQVAQLLAVDNATHPLTTVVIGTNDIARLTGTSMGNGRQHLLTWLSMILIHAKAHHLAVLDGVYNDFGDTVGFEAEVHQGRDMGFDGKTLIHPSQVAPTNAGFAPSAAQVAWAEAVLAAFALPENAAKGAIQIKGEMVERLHLEIAQRVLAATR